MTSDRSKRLLVIAGPNGSGKSSLVHSARLSTNLDKIINPDNYARGLSEDLADSVERYKIAIDSCEVLRERLLLLGISFGFETVASRQDKLDFVKRAKDSGYYIDFIFVTAGTPEMCYKRVQERVRLGGHDVPKDKLFARFERTMTYLHQYIELADHADIWDNSGDHLELMLTKHEGVVELTDAGCSSRWMRKYLPDLF